MLQSSAPNTYKADISKILVNKRCCARMSRLYKLTVKYVFFYFIYYPTFLVHYVTKLLFKKLFHVNI